MLIGGSVFLGGADRWYLYVAGFCFFNFGAVFDLHQVAVLLVFLPIFFTECTSFWYQWKLWSLACIAAYFFAGVSLEIFELNNNLLRSMKSCIFFP